MTLHSKHREFYWPTADDWHPNFPRDTVRVTVYTQEDASKAGSARWFLRICVWGADDDGMERDLHCQSKSELDRALEEALRFVSPEALPNPLTKAWLRERGFVPA